MKSIIVSSVFSAACGSPSSAPVRAPEAPAGAIAARELRGVALAGPLPSLAEACAALDPCSSATADMRVPAIARTGSPDCSAIERSELRTEADGTEIRIAPLTCKTEADRIEHLRYFAFVKRADGWWRSRPLFESNDPDRYCSTEVNAAWEQHDTRTFARISSTSSCVACTKQGDVSHGLQLLVGFGLDGATPAMWPPLVVGEHFTQAPHDDAAADVACARRDERLVLRETWLADRLELEGAAAWHPLWNEQDVPSLSFEEDKQAASPAGTYLFVR